MAELWTRWRAGVRGRAGGGMHGLARAALGMAAGVLGVCLGVSRAGADQVHSLRSDEMPERAHEVEATLFGDYAELRVRRTVHNAGARHDQATFFIDLPSGAVATRLRTLGKQGGRPHWFEGELLEAELAAQRYRELTGIGGYTPKDPALLSWRSQDLLALQVFPCPPGEDKSVEYTLRMPAEYRDGGYHLRLPALGTESLLATVVVRSQRASDRIFVDGKAVTSGAKVALSRDGEVEISLKRGDLPLLGGRLVTVPFDTDRVVTRYEVEAAPRLSEIPRGAHIVLVIDGSRSFAHWQAHRAAITAADAFLSHFERTGAEVQTLVFNRRVRARHAGFVPVATARRDLGGIAAPTENGSDVDRALYQASAWLAQAPRGVAKRIVLVTDGRTHNGLRMERLRAAVAGSGAILHAGIVREGAPALRRDDDHRWAQAARSTGGLVWQASAPADDRLGVDELRRAYEEWARPLRVDKLWVAASDLRYEPAVEIEASTLDEGQGLRALFVSDRDTPELLVQGELWSSPVQARLAPDASRRKLWAALTFGTELLHELTEPEMMALATLGGAVSPVTSYLAIEPGVRPSTEGIDWSTGGGGLGGGSAQIACMGGTMTSRRGPGLDKEAFLREHLARAWRDCGGTSSASVTLETTLDEIVAVSTRPEAPSAPLTERCLSEAAWALALPAAFGDEWMVWRVDV